MDRNGPAAAFLGCAVRKLDQAADLAVGVDHHVPGQVGDLSGPQPGLGREQDHHGVTERVAGAAGKDEQVTYISS